MGHQVQQLRHFGLEGEGLFGHGIRRVIKALKKPATDAPALKRTFNWG
jgi:hypothetical protein